MTRAGVVAALTVLASGGAPARARADDPEERGSALAAPRDGVRAAREAPAPTARAVPEYDGPTVELGYTHFVLADGFGQGDAHAFVFGGYLPVSPVRLGATVDFGVRAYGGGPDDALLRFTAIAGYQHVATAPLVPFVAAVATGGFLFARRFHTPLTNELLGLGLEAGVDLNVVRTLWTGVSLSYIRATMVDSGFNLFLVRLRIGL